MRYAASEKLEIVCLVEQSNLPVRRTLQTLGIPSTTFYFKRRGVLRVDDRRVLNGIFWLLSAEASWRDLPECCGRI